MTVSCKDNQKIARYSLARIRELLTDGGAVILDTETTGLKQAEVIEISIVNMAGEVLMDRLIRPRRMEMNPYAFRVHGITLDELADQPTLPELLDELSPILRGNLVLAWNASFDKLMIQRSLDVWGLEAIDFNEQCAMRLYAALHGQRSFGLQRAIESQGLQHLLEQHVSHRALGDANLVLELFRAVAVQPQPVLP